MKEVLLQPLLLGLEYMQELSSIHENQNLGLESIIQEVQDEDRREERQVPELIKVSQSKN